MSHWVRAVPGTDIDISDLRSLMVAHRSALSAPGRVGSIILAHRPAPLLVDDRLPDAAPPKGFDDQEFLRLQQHIARIAPSVGRIEVEDGGWRNIATGFRVSTDPRRVATARHVLRAILGEGVGIECRPDAQPFAVPPEAGYRPARIRFETPGGTDEVIAIEAIEWPHDRLDMMLLRLAGDCSRSPLELAPPGTADPAPGEAVCVIGYPMQMPADPAAGSFAVLFDPGEMGRKRASPGRITRRRRSDGAGLFRHDATTLGGSSGSPVVALDSGKVVGLHYFGGSGQTDPNRAVLLPAALTETELFRRMGDGLDPAQPAPDQPDDSAVGTRFGIALAALHAEGGEFAADIPPALAISPSVVADRFDRRDRFYRPSLAAPRAALLPAMPGRDDIHHQLDAFSCTGFALAAAIDRQLRERPRRKHEAAPHVSPAMLYGLATQHDEFVDDLPGGSSLRGAIKGFFHFGVCSASTAPYSGHDPAWHLTIAAAKEARNITLGAYYRLHPVLTDYQSALQEAQAVLVSAYTHSGWQRGAGRPVGTIPLKPGRLAAHAFVILGYDDRGFIIQNSWGPDWGEWKGRKGMARWTYADWADNVIDAWVIRLAPPSPAAFGLQVRQPAAATGDAPALPPGYARLRDARRSALIGHTIHAESTGIRGEGRLGLGPQAIRETALHLASNQGWKDYPALALIFHDPTTDADPVARLAAHMIAPLKANGLYPVHIHYGADEMRSLMVRMRYEAELALARAAGSGERLNGYIDRRARSVAQPLFEAWLAGCDRAVEPGGGLWQAMAGLGLEVARRGGGKNGAGKDGVGKDGVGKDSVGKNGTGKNGGRWRDLHLLSIGAGWFPARAFIAAREGMGFGPCASVGMVAPPADADPALPAGTRLRRWQLSAGAAADSAMPGYDGEWCDFLARLSRADAGPRRIGKGGIGADLGGAVTDAAVLNAVLAHMLGRKPARTRGFR